MDDALRATFAVIHTLEALGLDYLIGGSLASSLHPTFDSRRAKSGRLGLLHGRKSLEIQYSGF